VQRNAMASWKKGVEFKKLLMKDREIRKYLSKSEIDEIFNLDYYLKNIDYIYSRIFGKGRS
jgi:adenylosuccinate lyase